MTAPNFDQNTRLSLFWFTTRWKGVILEYRAHSSIAQRSLYSEQFNEDHTLFSSLFKLDVATKSQKGNMFGIVIYIVWPLNYRKIESSSLYIRF